MDQRVVNHVSEILAPTEEQKDRMLCNITAKYKNEMTAKGEIPRVKRMRKILVAAVAVCVLTTTAFAAVSMGLTDSILSFLKPLNAEQEETLANGAYLVDKQIKQKNGTLDIKQVMGDSNLTYIFMDFIAPEGTVLGDSYYGFQDFDIDFGNGFAGYAVTSLKDDNPTDNKVSLVLNIHTENSLMGKKLALEFTDLGSSDTFPGELTTAIAGEWKATIELNFHTYSTDYQVGQQVDLYSYPATLKSVSVSPISIGLKLESRYTKEIDEAAGDWKELGPNEYSDLYPVTICYADGSTETTDVFDGMHCLSGSGDILFIKTFHSVINDKNIESIEFFGTKIPIQ